MHIARRPGGLRTGTAVTLGLAVTLVLQPVATGADAPDTRLVAYSWSHTAHLATFSFDSPGRPDTSFECRLDGPSGGGWDACTSPRQYTSLDEGVYTFRVRAVAAGTVDPTPEERLFNIGVDTVPPETAFDSIDAPTTARSASFVFTSTESGGFECRRWYAGQLESDWATCASPLALADLPDGQHQVQVRAVDPSGEYDRTPASHTWLVDATAPETSMSVGRIEAGSASFSFTGGHTHECRLDGPAQAHDWTPCLSPRKYAGLPDGAYTFAVRALDHHGNTDPTPRAHSWVFAPAAQVFRLIQRPTVLGRTRVGKLLRATAGSWSPAPTTRHFQWLRNGHRIKHADGARYRVRRTDRGDRISVRVTVRRDGYLPARATAKARRIR